jgi:hypothetical protein
MRCSSARASDAFGDVYACWERALRCAADLVSVQGGTDAAMSVYVLLLAALMLWRLLPRPARR